MKLSDVVSHSGLHVYAEVALVLFAVAFVVTAIDVFRKQRQAHLEHQSRLPLDDGHVVIADHEVSR